MKFLLVCFFVLLIIVGTRFLDRAANIEASNREVLFHGKEHVDPSGSIRSEEIELMRKLKEANLE
ncbi:hypothetical protein A3715_17835 [Oleiphilus sp. HI0009]|nr:hypothetical protein A3715_17835 [Oleiphilus sp. HI0009]